MSEASIYQIKAATRDLVKLVGGVQRAAAIANVSAPSVSRWQTATTPDVIPVSAIIALEKEAEAPLVTAVLADLSGRALVESVRDSSSCIMAQHADFAEQVSETLSVATRALSDLRVTPAEATAVVKELRDLIATAKTQIRTLSAIAASGETWKVEVK